MIIPTLNEAEHIEGTLAALRAAVDVETLIVDGGSCDGTQQTAEAHGCRVLTAPPNRAGQMSLRSRWLQMPYGDQALFLKADTFHELGGFPDLPIMEDFEIVRRLRRRCPGGRGNVDS